jgi:hypothetical protein
MPIDKVEIRMAMADQLAEYVREEFVREAMRPFEDEWTDPLFDWSLDKCNDGSDLETLILLNNWYNTDPPIGTLRQNKEYIQRLYDRLDARRNDDPTFWNLFEPSSWSRRAIDEGACLVGNTAPGIWLNDSPTGSMSRKIYTEALTVLWLPLIRSEQPGKIYLCGGWANNLSESWRRSFPDHKIACHPCAWTKRWGGPDGPELL